MYKTDLHNSRYINSINRQHKSYTLAINHLADRTDDELTAFMGLKVLDGFIKGKKTDDIVDDGDNELNKIDDINKELDWRKFGAITKVKGNEN